MDYKFSDIPPIAANKSFGYVMAIFFLLLALWPLLRGEEGIRHWAVLVAAGFLLAAVFAPAALATANRIWLGLGYLLHKVTSPVALGLIFFGVITPIGFLMKLVRKQPLKLKFDKPAATYWIDRRTSAATSDSFKDIF